MHQPTRFQIMRLRREEACRWERVRRQRELEEAWEPLHQQAVERREVMQQELAPLRQALIAKVNECERQEVTTWAGRAPPRTHGTLVESPPEPECGWLSRLFFSCWWRK